jgi:hypothetical protein
MRILPVAPVYAKSGARIAMAITVEGIPVVDYRRAR